MVLHRADGFPADLLPPFQEEEFLPPMNRWLRGGALLLVGLVVGGAGLAAVMPYNVTVAAIATIRPVNGISLVQAQTGGTIRQIWVKENQAVKQGDAIADLGGLDPLQLSLLQTRRRQTLDYIHQYQAQINQIDQQLQAPNPPITANSDIATATRDRLQQQRQGLARQIEYDQATLQSLDQELGKAVILVPTDGTIFKLELRNPGQTVQPGDVVAQIVPSQTALIAKAQVSVQDISRVEVGQLAQLRISAYPYPDYGILNGRVQAIAPDTAVVRDPNTGVTLSYYEVTIQPDHPYLTRGDRQYPLQPGMEARVDIVSQQETIMQSVLRQLRLSTDL